MDLEKHNLSQNMINEIPNYLDLIIPNALGCASAIVQLIVFIVYRKM